MMSAIRDFFKKKKADIKFKTAGPGHKLNESPNRPGSSSSSAIVNQPTRHQLSEGVQRAGAAALARFEQKQPNVNWSSQAVKAQARKEIEKELEKELQNKLVTVTPPKKDLVVQDACPTLTVSGVYFKCPIIGPEILPKKDIKKRIKEFLYEQLEQEKGLTACLIIHTVNENKDKVQLGVETLARYLTNILDNPDEEKYQKIRLNNRIFQERIMALEGTFEFFEAAGFTKENIGEEEYLVFSGVHEDSLENLQMLKEALFNAEAIIPILDRNMKVLKPSQVSSQINLPDDFFSLSAKELQREQSEKSETVELMTQLRTKEMRERDAVKELHIYKYTLIRVRFPDGIILQGTFYVYERLSAVKEFIVENLCNPEQEFHLLLSGGLKLIDDSNSLIELKLVPAVLLNFLWTNSSSDSNSSFLKPDVLALLEDL